MQNAGLAGLSILVVEDEPLLRKQIAAELTRLEADVTTAAQSSAAREFLARLDFDLALVDVNLPDGKGTDLLRERLFSTHTGVVVMTAEGGVEGAVEAMRLGALDYLVKPFDSGELPVVLLRACRVRQAVRLDEHRRREESQSTAALLFGSSLAAVEAQLQKILAADRRLQTCLPAVLIEGETGTGKTSVARWLHEQGPRADMPLVEMNCSAVPESLAESELFGHERGAFTDARTARMGLLEAAHGGALFLDELPSLSPSLQAKLLSAIEDRKIRRVGSNKTVSVDVRVIAATNKEMRPLVAQGLFREDLFHRLDLCRVHLPPLRERGEDIVALAELFVEQLCRRHRFSGRKITAEGRARLLAYRWPGNVRELRHELERAIIFEESTELDFGHLRPAAKDSAPASSGADWFNERYQFPAGGFLMDQAINRLIQHALNQTNQNVSAAARLLGVTRDYIRYRLPGA